ncbi:hypothetical protein [Algihabitans albus]|uniref:hypothetical protein n=1 Tax=Algihabitans albus TaxID=2164067 RepID=UPI000E5D28AB|nr:hypothetical protein [Algihabitans albus]
MNNSLQRYVDFRQMMTRQAEAPWSNIPEILDPSDGGAEALSDRLLFERSAVLQDATEQVEAMRLTFKAIGEAPALGAFAA